MIIIFEWPEAIKTHGYGNIAYEEGFGTSIFLAILLTGILVLLYAVGVHIVLSHWMFEEGELKEYRARQLVKSIKTKNRQKQTATETKTSSRATIKHDD
jgi:hypothetical protein